MDPPLRMRDKRLMPILRKNPQFIKMDLLFFKIKNPHKGKQALNCIKKCYIKLKSAKGIWQVNISTFFKHYLFPVLIYRDHLSPLCVNLLDQIIDHILQILFIEGLEYIQLLIHKDYIINNSTYIENTPRQFFPLFHYQKWCIHGSLQIHHLEEREYRSLVYLNP